jgi:hypothetical protein
MWQGGLLCASVRARPWEGTGGPGRRGEARHAGAGDVAVCASVPALVNSV